MDLLQSLQQLGDGEHDDLSVAHDALTEIVELRLQLAEARELLIRGWCPADDTGYPCEEWVKRRDALLIALAGKESE